MSAFMLVIWISLIVILNVRGDGNLNEILSENMSLCEHCNSKTLPECSANESLSHNLTIHCPQTEPKPCVIAVVNGYAGNNETEFMCLLNELLDIAENTIEAEKFGNLLENQDSAMTTELPAENASVEEVKPQNAAETELQTATADSETAREDSTIAATTTNDSDNPPVISEAANSEPKSVENADADEMPQADQPLEETEANNEPPAEIEDNKIELTAAAEATPTETTQTTPAQTDAEARMNAVDEKTSVETKVQMLSCYGCVSSTNSNCRTKPTQTVACKTTEIGANGCYTLQNDTHSERGCLDELAKHRWDSCLDPNDLGCQLCNENLCNVGVSPAKRLLCHQCADTLECALEQETENAAPCSEYAVEDSCFLYADGNGNMKRGCKSDRQLYQQCQTFGEKRCLTCKSADGYNSQPFLSKPKLYCSSCDSRATEANEYSKHCAWAQSETSVTRCQNYYPYYLEELCVMSHLPDIELSVRGCSLDIGACERACEWCHACNTSGCNVGNLVTQLCLQCSSDLLENCSNDIKGLKAESCTAEVQTYETRGCYVSWNLDSNITTRGCISDLTAEGIDYCRAKKNLCVLCHENGCNNLLAPSSTARKTTAMKFGFLLIGLLYIL